MKKTLIPLIFLTFLVQMRTHGNNIVEKKNDTVSIGIPIIEKFKTNYASNKILSSVPLGLVTTIQYKLDFENFYGNQNIDMQCVEINFASFWNAFIQNTTVFNSWQNETSQGLNILYALDSISGNRHFSYSFYLGDTLNCAQINNNLNYFIPNFSNQSLVLDPSGASSVTPDMFNSYFNTVKMRDFTNFGAGPTTLINTIQCNAVSAHPRIEFIQKHFLHQFITNNNSSLFNGTEPKNNVRIVFSHGARVVVFNDINPACTLPLNLKHRFHVPYVYITGSNNVPLIDEVIYPNAPFTNKALNLGRLCPPQCPLN